MNARQELVGNGFVVKVTAGLNDLKGSMRKSDGQPGIVVSSHARTLKFTDTSGNPSESYFWSHLAAVRRELKNQFCPRYVEVSEMKITEMRNIEAQVRKTLYP